ncbi:hypothetical protein L7F22_022571 [Adiantum nelumboides]|nr:hypothetical protein [Adiantum nelumboides]
MASACAHLHPEQDTFLRYIKEAASSALQHELNSAIAIIRLHLRKAARSLFQFPRSRVIMGNHGSSTTYAPDQYNHITVVVGMAEAGEGRVVEVEVESSSPAMKVGELLLEFSPGHFVAHFSRSCFPFHLLHSAATATSLSSAALPRLLERASAQRADADAMAGAANVYVLLPMPRLHTRLSPQERLIIARLLHNHAAMSRLARKRSRGATCNGKLQARSFLWGRCTGGAARVAPLHDDQQETSMVETQLAEEKEQELQLGHEQLYPQVIITMPKLPVVMMKAKPWAPKLETISEDQQEGRFS